MGRTLGFWKIHNAGEALDLTSTCCCPFSRSSAPLWHAPFLDCMAEQPLLCVLEKNSAQQRPLRQEPQDTCTLLDFLTQRLNFPT